MESIHVRLSECPGLRGQAGGRVRHQGFDQRARKGAQLEGLDGLGHPRARKRQPRSRDGDGRSGRRPGPLQRRSQPGASDGRAIRNWRRAAISPAGGEGAPPRYTRCTRRLGPLPTPPPYDRLHARRGKGCRRCATQRNRPRTRGGPRRCLEEIARSCGAVWQRFSGQRPKSTSVEISKDVVKCMIEGTRARLSVRGGRRRGIGHPRLTPAGLKHNATAVITRITGRQVSAFIVKRDKQAEVSTQTFILDQPRQRF